jgi:alpha-amylase/alpha-mannosidase (GH57 family)
MTGSPKLYLNLYWHMHQPDYRDIRTGEYMLPWTYLHAIKDYSDMAYHLEKNEKAKVTFNFVPILIEQLLDYANQFENNAIRDPLLALLIKEDTANLTQEDCRLIVDSCFKAHHEKMLEPFPSYKRLLDIYTLVKPMQGVNEFYYLSPNYKTDLLVWYHLAWTGETLRRENKTIQALMRKGTHFTYNDRKQLFNEIKNTINGLIPRYKALLDRGQIEISTTPYYHPILPLLIDFASTKDAMPNAPLPKNILYPDGTNRSRHHIEYAKNYHEQIFGEKPVGMWPAEGGVSHAALSLMAEQNITWTATGQSVLVNSLNMSGVSVDDKNDYLYQPYRVTNGKQDVLCFFRDDSLSDKIGFEYSKMHTSLAVSDFINALEDIINKNPEQSKVVSVILDGENAWEYYPYNGYYFISELYEALVKHPDIEMSTFSDVLKLKKQGVVAKAKRLNHIAAGSWVYGTFSTWIGSTDKNAAWDLLCDAKKVYDQHIHQLDAKDKEACEKQLSICEGSDWFWWFGDYNSSQSVQSFDSLYRLNLINLYELLKQPVPERLHQPISQGGGNSENAGTMRRGQDN